MLSTLLMLLALQVRMAGPPPTPSIASDATMAEGAKGHFNDGITLIGKLVWPADVTPSIVFLELEDASGLVVQDTKSEPNNQFRFTGIQLIEPITNSFLTYYISINDVPGLDIVHQQFSPTTNNFTTANVTIQLRHLPGLLSRNSEAVISIDGMKKEAPKEALDILDKALSEQHKGDDKKADADFERALKIAPDFYEANLELGLDYEKAGRHEEATKLLTHAIELNPASMRARAALGQQAYEKNQFKEAADFLSEAVRLGNISSDIYFMLGVSYLKLDDTDSAEPSLQRAIAIAPGQGRNYLALHNVYLKTRQLDKALAALDTYTEKFPNAEDHEQVKSAADKLRKAVHPQPQ